jgi:hypothetical protein
VSGFADAALAERVPPGSRAGFLEKRSRRRPFFGPFGKRSNGHRLTDDSKLARFAA